MSSEVVRVKSWEEFKQLILKYNPESIAYNIEQEVPARNLTSLRLMLPVEGTQYVFIDTASEGHLRKTHIALHKDKHGNISIKDEEIKNFENGIKEKRSKDSFLLDNMDA